MIFRIAFSASEEGSLKARKPVFATTSMKCTTLRYLLYLDFVGISLPFSNANRDVHSFEVRSSKKHMSLASLSVNIMFMASLKSPHVLYVPIEAQDTTKRKCKAFQN